jgi:hypothetical protein
MLYGKVSVVLNTVLYGSYRSNQYSPIKSCNNQRRIMKSHKVVVYTRPSRPSPKHLRWGPQDNGSLCRSRTHCSQYYKYLVYDSNYSDQEAESRTTKT